MKLYRNGYVVSEVKDNDYTYNVWPFEDVDDDKNAMMLTEEADNTWFLQYDMQHNHFYTTSFSHSPNQ